MAIWKESRWPRYVSVAEKRERAAKQIKKLSRKGQATNPVSVQGREIATTFWGKAWCKNLETYMDYDNRLPRGRTYVRNGSVIHLEISEGQVKAMVAGSSLYQVVIGIKSVKKERWSKIKQSCSGRIDSLLALLKGQLADSVLATITSPDSGLFPELAEIQLQCSCPDWAKMCKHVAATLYGVGTRLDSQPELLFRMRGVDHKELAGTAQLAVGTSKKQIKTDSLSQLFGIELSEAPQSPPKRSDKAKSKAPTKVAKKKTKKVKAKTVVKKSKTSRKKAKSKKIRK